jgi:5-methyltetrahydrofolate--homocysteine methyltransferase
VLGFRAAGSERPVIAKGNAGIPKYVDGHIHYDGTPELMARYAVLARDAGAKIIGGCCGTQPDHLRQMRAALEDTPEATRRRWRSSRRSLAGFPRAPTERATMRAPRASVADGGAPGGDGHRMPNRKIALHHAYHERFFRVRAFAR